MKIGFVADVHVGNFKAHGGEVTAGVNWRCTLVLDTLTRAVDRAVSEGVGTLVVLGDLFDDAKPLPQVVQRLQRILWRHDLRVIVLLGNHDRVSTALGDHALGPLSPRSEVWIVEQPGDVELADGVDLIAVPFLSNVSAAEVITDALPAPGRRSKREFVLAFHYGIIGADTPGFLRDGLDAVDANALGALLRKHRVRSALAGHWHSHQRWADADTEIVQVGALAPTGWRDAGLSGYGSLVVYDTTTCDFVLHEIAGPRFVVGGVDALSKRGGASHLFLRCGYSPEDGTPTVKVPEWATLELVPDLTEVVVATRSAAVAARNADSMEDALAAYVAAMSLPEGVDREAVLQRTRAYLEGREVL